MYGERKKRHGGRERKRFEQLTANAHIRILMFPLLLLQMQVSEGSASELRGKMREGGGWEKGDTHSFFLFFFFM